MRITEAERFAEQLKQGFVRVPNLLLEALPLAQLSAVQMGICNYLWRRTYGWNRTQAPVSLVEFATGCNTSKGYASKQIIRLLDDQIIRRVRHRGKLYYWFETDLSQWKSNPNLLGQLYSNQQAGIYNYARKEPPGQGGHPVHNEYVVKS